MIDATLHTFATGGTILVTVAAGVGIYFADEAAGDVGFHDPLDRMVVIDAALAEKSSAESKQPQKEFAPPPDPVKPVGVTRDENAKPVTDPEPPKPPKPDTPNIDEILKKNRASDDDELPVGKPKFETGRIDGDEVGFGDKTFGNRYLGELKSGFLRVWEYPEILDDTGIPVGCIQLDRDGKIGDVELKVKSGNDLVDDSVERALAEFKDKVNKDPRPLPTEPDDLTPLARMPLCWRLKV
jgi:hypothetical protein